MVDELLAELAEAGVTLVSDGDRLRFYPRAAMTPELAERLRTSKAEVLAIMANPWPEAEHEPAPCEKCISLELWETLIGRWRCMKCDPPEKARRWLDKAERLRKRYGLPDPMGPAE